jgi:hypothetical protein
MDGDTAVITGLERIGDASGRTARKIKADNSESERSFDSVKEGAGRLHGVLGSVMGTVGLAGVGFGIKDVIQAGMKWQTQTASLGRALKNAGIYSRGLLDSLGKSAELQSTRGGFAAPEQLAGIQQFVTETHSATKASQLNTAAMNLARGQHIQYLAAVKMVAGVESGSPGRLSKILGPLTSVTKYTTGWTAAMKQANPLGYAHAQMQNKIATATELTGMIQKRFGGQMSAYSHTAAGAISNAENAIDIAMMKIGTAVMPVVAKVATWFATNLPKAMHTAITVIKSVVTWFEQNRGVAIALGVGLGILATGFIALRVVSGITALMAAFNVVLDANPIGAVVLALTALTAGVIYAYNHSRTFRNTINDLWSAMKAVGRWIGSTFAGIWHDLGHAIHIALAPLIAMYNLAKKVTGFVGGVFGGGHSPTTKQLTQAQRNAQRTIGIVPHAGHAVGGLISGYGGGDQIPSLLERGEYVVRKEAVAQIGVPALNQINAGSGGGMPDGTPIKAEIEVTQYVDGKRQAKNVYHQFLKYHARTGVIAA